MLIVSKPNFAVYAFGEFKTPAHEKDFRERVLPVYERSARICRLYATLADDIMTIANASTYGGETEYRFTRYIWMDAVDPAIIFEESYDYKGYWTIVERSDM